MGIKFQCHLTYVLKKKIFNDFYHIMGMAAIFVMSPMPFI